MLKPIFKTFTITVLTALTIGMIAAGVAGAQTQGMTVLKGQARDAHGGAVVGADVSLMNGAYAVLRNSKTNAEGRFEFDNVPQGKYLLRVSARGFSERRLAVNLIQGEVADLTVDLAVEPLSESVTVTAYTGLVAETAESSQPVDIIPPQEIQERAKAVVAQVATEEAGVHLQRTSPTIAGIFVRGLTGNKVNVFIDGVRYSTASARGGINTFLDLIEPSDLGAVEILRGPNSAQYGSDAIGGSVQFITRVPAYEMDKPTVRGRFSTFANTADASFGSNASASFGTRQFGMLVSTAGRRVSTLRTGNGIDPHSAFTRFFGLSSAIFQDERRPDTAFTQYGGLVRVSWSPTADSQLIAHYNRSQQDGGKRYDQLLGGDGNLIADLRNLMLDFFYLRYNHERVGWLDHVSLTYSLNSQREERVNQGGNGNPKATVTHEYERTTVQGVQGMAMKQWGTRQSFLAGGEYYHERVRAPSFGFNPVSQAVSLRRGRVPDRSLYQSGGIYAQDVFDLVPGKVRLAGNLRWSRAAYRVRAADSPLVGGNPLWPDDRLETSSVTFRGGVVVTPVKGFSLNANISRGFRAPHITDLGTLGLTGSGFEVAAPDVAGLGATIGDSASGNAASTGLPVVQVAPETSINYDFGAHYRNERVETSFSFFVNNIKDQIVKQALILPAGAVGQVIGGQTITTQNAGGAVFVAASTNPVLVRANFDNARLYGFEHTFEARLNTAWTVGTVFTYIHARDTRTDLPPNIEGGTPAPDGYLKIRYSARGGRLWIEPYVHAAGRQSALSSLDLEDRRTGATRSRTNIRNFFLNGATARGLVGAGPDATLGTADDVLLASGETLAQIQTRVLGTANSAPLFTAVPGYVTFNVRGGMRIGERHEVLVDFENIGDRNYRGISWGVDAPGRSLFFRFTSRF